jgi:hypothetical protein
MKPFGALAVIASVLLSAGCAHLQIVRSYDPLRAALKPGDHVEVTMPPGPPSGVVEAVSTD